MGSNFEDNDNFELLFKEYFNPLVNFIFSYLKSYEDAREVVQQTFYKIWANRHNLVVNSSTKNYLFQSAKNCMIDYIRANKPVVVFSDIGEWENQSIVDDNYLPIDPYIVRQAIDKCLSTVKPKARDIFILNKYEGLTYEEIANHLKISKRTVEDNIAKILKYLKAELKNHPDLFD